MLYIIGFCYDKINMQQEGNKPKCNKFVSIGIVPISRPS